MDSKLLKMKRLMLLIIFLGIVSCQSQKIKYSGLNDLVFGVQQIVLYENRTFYLELGAGGTDGNYLIHGDTILLIYNDRPSDNWPSRMLIQKNEFISIDFKKGDKNFLRIKRNI
jgi:hypothetical protein